VDKPSSEAENGTDDNDYCSESPPHHNNNNSPPYKKAHMQSGERNGMIQNIVTELKSAKKASSQLESLFPKNPSHSTFDGDFSSGGSDEDEDEERSLQIKIEEEEAAVVDLGGPKYGTNKRRGEEKVNLANIRTLLSSSIRSADSHRDAEDGDGDEEEGDGIDMRKGGSSEAEDGDHHQLPFRCGVCRFGTTDRRTLSLHMKTHSAEKSFQCRLCCFAFTTKVRRSLNWNVLKQK